MSPEPDEVWAYRARGVDPLTPVRVVRHGQNTPPRVLIHFVDEQMEGREEWVPPARLKVPWAEVDDFIAVEARWQAVYDLSPSNEDHEGRAAERVSSSSCRGGSQRRARQLGSSVSKTDPHLLT